uniref:BPTI/Kunitz inhibitor domain-containing protein n=1 Tax=Anas zonorhyncha TaxID=75864 RepID=A0A8B9ZUL2_9AVES
MAPISPPRSPESLSVPLRGLPTASPSPGKGRRAVVVPGLCALDKDPGTACADFSLRWYHRRDTGTCERFWYGGCGGNANRFGTQKDCVHTCVGTGRRGEGVGGPTVHRGGLRGGFIPSPTPPGVPWCLAAACLEARDAGPCRSYSPKWFFEEPGRCSLFWYGGCGGSRNRFESREQCEALCVAPGKQNGEFWGFKMFLGFFKLILALGLGAGGVRHSPQQTPPAPCHQPPPQILQPPGMWGLAGGVLLAMLPSRCCAGGGLEVTPWPSGLLQGKGDAVRVPPRGWGTPKTPPVSQNSPSLP